MEERLAKTRARTQVYEDTQDINWRSHNKGGTKEKNNSWNKREITPTKEKVAFITKDKHNDWQQGLK